MNFHPELWFSGAWRWIWRMALAVGLLWGTVYTLGRLKVLIAWVIISAVLAYVMRPVSGWLARTRGFVAFHNAAAKACAPVGILFRRLGRAAAGGRQGHPPHGHAHGHRRGIAPGLTMHTRRTIATLYVLILFFVGSWYSAKFMLSPFFTELKGVSDNWGKGGELDLKKRFEDRRLEFQDWYQTNVSPEWRESIDKQLEANKENSELPKRAGEIVGYLSHFAGAFAHNIVEIVLLPVLAFYFALDSKKLKHEIVGALPRRWRKEVSRMIHEFNLIMYSFVVGQFILCAIAGVFVWALLAALGVKYSVTLGIFAGFTRAIPIIGPILGGIPIIVLTLVTQGLPTSLVVLSAFTIMHFAESKFIMPMLIGERMNLHPVVIILVLLVGQEFGGLLGMFFAAPIAALARVVIRRYLLKQGLPKPVGDRQTPTVSTA
jgi:predicted PurR-regulated permease PerM